MKLLWLCNMVPGKVKEAVSGGSTGGGLWVDSVLEGLLGREDLNIRILCPGDGGEGKVNARCSYAFFSEGLPYVYLTELETQFRGELDTFQPDVIHVWGTEYGHTLPWLTLRKRWGGWTVWWSAFRDFARFMPGIMPRVFRSRFSGAAPSVMLSGGTIS